MTQKGKSMLVGSGYERYGLGGEDTGRSIQQYSILITRTLRKSRTRKEQKNERQV